MTNDLNRQRILSPTEFWARIDRLFELYPGVEISSSWRSEGYNKFVKGHPESKHLYSPGMPIAVDLTFNNVLEVDTSAVEITAKTLGLYGTYHDKGSGPHLHLQALPPGTIPEWYTLRYNIYKNTRRNPV